MNYSVAESYFKKVSEVHKLVNFGDIHNVIRQFEVALNDGKQIFIFGNGGSASTASHVACDINKGASYGREKRFKIICLNDNKETLLAYANDVSYESVFEEQLKNFLKSGDLVVGISGSGNSMNVINAVTYARERGAITMGWTGFDGGKLKSAAEHCFIVPINDMQIIEDVHLSLNHILMKYFTDESNNPSLK